MKKLFIAKIIDKDTGETLTMISAYSQESLEQEMGKKKWSDFAKIEEKNEISN